MKTGFPGHYQTFGDLLGLYISNISNLIKIETTWKKIVSFPLVFGLALPLEKIKVLFSWLSLPFLPRPKKETKKVNLNAILQKIQFDEV